MIERSQNLPLAQESVAHEVGVHPPFDDLDRDLLPELLVVTLGFIDRAHPTAPDQASYAVWPNALSSQIVFGFGGERQGGARDRIQDEVFGGIPREKGKHFVSQFFVVIADPRQVVIALGRRVINQGAKKLFNASPAFRIHGGQGFISRRSHARASLISWPIVAMERPSSAAVSSKLKPPK